MATWVISFPFEDHCFLSNCWLSIIGSHAKKMVLKFRRRLSRLWRSVTTKVLSITFQVRHHTMHQYGSRKAPIRRNFESLYQQLRIFTCSNFINVRLITLCVNYIQVTKLFNINLNLYFFVSCINFADLLSKSFLVVYILYKIASTHDDIIN